MATSKDAGARGWSLPRGLEGQACVGKQGSFQERDQTLQPSE